jgi:hypothetical protein
MYSSLHGRNNVPSCGKREMSRHHEMAWLRIDRYYYGDVDNPVWYINPDVSALQ